MTFEEWRALTPEEAADYTAKKLRLDDDRTKKLVAILRYEWAHPQKRPAIATECDLTRDE